MSAKATESKIWNSTIDSISHQLGNITASSSSQDAEPTKRRCDNQIGNRMWKSKEKSLSEEPMGLDGLRRAEERRSRETSLSLTPGRHQMERRSCRLRFKSPSDSALNEERPNLHQTSLVKNNQLKIRSHMKITRLTTSASSVSLNSNLVIDSQTPYPSPAVSPKPVSMFCGGAGGSEDDDGAGPSTSTEGPSDDGGQLRRQSLKRRVRCD